MSARNPEDEYFSRVDKEVEDKLRDKVSEEKETIARQELRVLHHHRCGKCGGPMDTHPFKGVEIEVCPECGAVLLDKGELEALAGNDSSGILKGIVDLFSGK